MRKIEKKKLTLKKFNVASMEQLQSIKGKSGICSGACSDECSDTCSGKTHPSVDIVDCLGSLLFC